MYTLDNLQQNKIADLKEIATKLNLKKFQKLNKTDLIYKILDEQATQSTVSSKEVIEKKEDHSGSKKKRERFV
ncbi:MAG: transcription termination factor Rho, partial [Flavobacteriales bacterium]|nr:transcription termination factor Rho [Flavobacteriales bacterium]